MRELIDETGRQVAAPMAVQRIVSLAPNLTEIIYALGVQDHLVGVTDYTDYPPEAREKPRVGGPVNPSLEEIVALRPDLVLADRSINRRVTVEALERLGVAVYTTYPQSLEGVFESIRHIADLLGASAAGEDLVMQLRARLEDLRQQLAGHPPKRVLFIVWEEPLITVGPHTFLADALRWAGAESVIDVAEDWPHISLEAVARREPDYLVFASSHPATPENTSTALRRRAGWRDLKAVREGHIAVVSDAIDRPSPRLVDAVEKLARQLHPEAFGGERKNENPKIENRQRTDEQEPPFLSNFRFPFPDPLRPSVSPATGGWS